MSHRSLFFIIPALLALSGCGDVSEERAEAVAESLEIFLEENGLTGVVYQSSAFEDGRAVVKGVTAKHANGSTIAIDEVSFVAPATDHMLTRWHDFGEIVIADKVLYEGHAPRPRGFTSDEAYFSGVTVANDDSGYTVRLDQIRFAGFDATKGAERIYEAVSLANGNLARNGNDILAVETMSLGTSGWRSDVGLSLVTDFRMKGAFSSFVAKELSTSGLAALVNEDTDLGFEIVQASDVDPVTGEADLGFDLVTQSYGELSLSLSLAGVDDALLQNSAEVAARFAEFSDTGSLAALSGVDVLDPFFGFGPAIVDEVTITGKGLGWLDQAFEMMAPGQRDILVDMFMSTIDLGSWLGQSEMSDDVETSIGRMALFIKDPETFVLKLKPEPDLTLKEIYFSGSADNAVPSLDRLGFSFTQEVTEETE